MSKGGSSSSEVKKDAKTLQIKEQTIWRDASGLTIEFLVIPEDKSHPYRIRLYGKDLKFGNRELTFSPDGVNNGSGTGLICPTNTILPD